MGMYCDVAAGDRMIDGIDGGNAVHHRGSDHIEVWCEEYELHYGNLPADSTVEQINAAIRFYHAGEKAGIRYGEIKKQHEIRRSFCQILDIDLDAVTKKNDGC
ncbi:TPA: hypothetical protein ACYLN4_000607 [Burkholderia lata]